MAERKHRHLLDYARAIRIHTGLPKYFWGECILAATHIINKLPMANLNWKTPFERLYKKRPTYYDLRVIGCLSFVANLKPTDKFDTRAKKCILLGYPFGYKGYKLYDLETKKTFHSRDVIFHENIFPFKKGSTYNGNVDITPGPSLQAHLLPSIPHVAPTYSEHTISTSDSLQTPSNSAYEPVISDLESLGSLHQIISDISTPSSSSYSSSIHGSSSSSTHHDHIPFSNATVQSSFAPSTPTLRRSDRSRGPPVWLQDYICPQQVASVSQPSTSQSQSLTTVVNPYPLFTYANMAHLSPSFMASLTKVLQTNEPYSYAQAKQYPEWVKAMDQELTTLDANHTWVLTSLPHGKRALTSKWVFKTKYNPDGSVDRHKARLVIRGFEQIKDKDCKHTFSLLAKLTTVRLFVALATAKNWPLHQLDINNAFLHGYIDEEVYMLPPEGYNKALPSQV